MVVSKLVSGLGNQLFQYTLARQLSLDRNAILKLDISSFESQNLRSYKLNHYNIEAEVADEAEIASYFNSCHDQSVLSKLYRKLITRKRKYKDTVFVEAEWWVYEPEIFMTPSNVYVDGYWQHYKYFEHISPVVLNELTLKQVDYGDSYEAILKEISSNASSVSVHVRRGDYVTDPAAYNFMGVLSTTYYERAIACMRKKIKNPRFYFFSDDVAWVKDNLVVDESMTVVEIQNGADYLDLDLMSKCSHNIIANSSFSWWGAFLNKNSDKVVIAPKQWVVQDEINRKIEIVFPSWIKL